MLIFRLIFAVWQMTTRKNSIRFLILPPLTQIYNTCCPPIFYGVYITLVLDNSPR